MENYSLNILLQNHQEIMDNEEIIKLFRESGEVNFIRFLDKLEKELEQETIQEIQTEAD